ncbi:MAG: DUF6770 family protein [Bacteroidia bacterium]
MSKKLVFILAYVFISVTSAVAQTASITDIKKVYLQSARALIENDQVKGYYTFTFMDKANKKENIYVLNIMDNNLEIVYSVELVKDRNFILLESSFNGTTFCFSFINYKKKVVEYMILDNKGETAGTYTTQKLSNSELQYMTTLVTSEDDTYSGGIIAVPGQGFVRYGMEKGNGWRYIMELIDNKGDKVWEATSGNENKKAYEWTSPMYANENTIVTMVNTREKYLSTKNTKVYCVFTDAKTGEEVFKTEPESDGAKKYSYQPIGVSYDVKLNEYFMYGEYFKKGDNVAKDKSEGFYFQNLSNDGKVNHETFASWTGDIAKVIKVSSKGKMEDGMSVAIHTMVRTSDGKIFAIGEQYKKAVSAGGVALNVLAAAAGGSTDASIMKIELHDIVIFEFDEKLKLDKANIFEKAKTNIQLPKGYEFLSTPMLGFMMKSYGLFDYNFTICSSDKSTFNCAYTNYDKTGKEDKAASNYIIGNIAYTGGKLVSDKIRLEKKPTAFLVMPAKPGYIAIMEYFKKKKTIDLRLEKLNN